MKSHRYQFVYVPIERFLRQVGPVNRLLLTSLKLVLFTSLVLFQLYLFKLA